MTSLSINTIEIHIFRGNRLLKNLDERLEKYGHVGISFDNGNMIAGFNPVPPPGTSRSEFLRRLEAGESFPGQVVPAEAWLFAEAKKFKLNHREEKHFLDADICLNVKRQLDNDIKNSPLNYKRYSFPPKKTGGFALSTFNCLTYPLSLDIPASLYPYQSGRLGDYLEQDEYLIIKYECR